MPQAEIDWPAIRVAYEAKEKPVDAIAAEFSVQRSAIYNRARRDGWQARKPNKPASRQNLIARLSAMLESQIAHLETTMTPGDDKEIALLGTMARTLEKLIELDKKDERAKPAAARDREMTAMRKKLAARINDLKKR